MPLDDLKKIAILRRIKDYDILSKGSLIYPLLRSEKNLFEDNYMKRINHTTDDEIKAKINAIRVAVTKLGNIVTKEERNIIRKELHKIESKKRLTKAQKERIRADLIELANILDKKEIHKYADHDDLPYFRIRDIYLLILMIMIITNLY